MFVPVEALIWARSFITVLLIVAHALRHVEARESQIEQKVQPLSVITQELLDELQELLNRTGVVEAYQKTPQIAEEAVAKGEQKAPPAPMLFVVAEEREEE